MSSIYTILENLNKVTTVKQEPQENKKSQPVHESVEAKGSILKGVATVEQKLREQFATFDEERETLKTKSGTIYKGGKYGTEYQGDADDEDAPKRGRPAAGTAKKEKVLKVKGPKGRPKKDPAPTYSKSNDPFGRVPDKAPKGAKGTVVKGKATQDTVDESQLNELSPELLKKASDEAGMKWAHADDRRDAKASDKYNAQHDKFHSAWHKKQKQKDMDESSNPFASFKKQAKGAGALRSKTLESSYRMAKLLIEGVNFTEMIKKKDMTLQEMLAELQADIQAFKETGHCSELLRDCMEVHSYGKSQLNDATENPMDNDNFPTPLAPAQAPSMMDRAKRFGSHVLNKLGHGSDEDMKADLRRKMDMQEAAELNELARLAGLTVKEGNDGNLANNAKPYKTVTRRDVIQGAQGKDEMGGKEQKLREHFESMGDILSNIAQKFAQKADQDHDLKDHWTREAGIFMKAAQTIEQSGMEAGMQVLNDCDCWDALGDELEWYDIDVQELVDAYGLDQHMAGRGRDYDEDDYRNFGSDYDGANEDPHGYDDEMDEAAKYRDPKYKDRLYTQEPRSPEDDYHDLDYYTGAKPDDYAGSKNLIGGGEFDHNDPLQKGFGRYGHDVLDRGPRKGMPSRNHITSLKGSIKAAHGTHSEPNLPEGAEAEASGFYVNYEIRTGDPERVAGPFASQQEAQAWINDNVPNPSDEPYYNISQVGFNEDDMEEGAGVMHFKALQAKADGKDSFKLGNEEFPVQEGETCPTCKSEPCACEDTEAADRELAKLKENCGIVSPIGSMAQDMQQQQGKMSINTNQSSDGTKNISISADGEAADQLMQILKMAGMAGGQHAEVVVSAQPMEAKEYGDTTVEEPEEVLNTPRPRVKGMHSAETVGLANTSDDLHKQKGQHPKTAAKGDNPLATNKNHEETLESINPLDSLGAKLMAEYQAIKITK